MSISPSTTSYHSYAIEDVEAPLDLTAAHLQQGGRVVMGGISGAPTLVSATPADNSGAVAIGANIVLTFSGSVTATSGATVRIGDGYTQSYIDKAGHTQTRWVGSTDSHTVDLNDTSQVTISGNTVTINLFNDLKPGVSYSVTMAAGALQDQSFRPYSGLADSTKLNFTTDTSVLAQVSGAIHFEDSGVSSTDYITNSAAQTVHGTYSGTLGAGEHVEVSIDNGVHWYTANATAGSWSYSGFDPVSASSTMLAHVVDANANPRSTLSQAFTFDNTAPAVSMADRSPQLSSSDDSGSSHSDHLTNVESPSLRFVTSGLGGFAAGDLLQVVDSNHGNAVVASHVLTAQELSGGFTAGDYFDLQPDSPLSEGLHNLVLQVGDLAGNAGAASSNPLALTIDRSAPTLVSAAPVEGGSNVVTDTTIVLTFNEDIDVRPDTSFLLSDGTILTEQQLGVESGNVSVSGHTVTITLGFALDVSSNYTLKLTGGAVSDLAGNIGVDTDTEVLHFSTTSSGLAVPGAPTLGFTDTGSATGGSGVTSDGITNERTVTVGNLAGGSTKWYYSTDGSTWHLGSGNSFTLGADDHTYAAHEIQVKQTNFAGVSSSITSNTDPLTVDLTAPDAHIAPASSDFVSNDGSATITGLYTYNGTDDGVVEVSFDNGSHWTTASTGPVSPGVRSWSVTDSPTGPIVVRISDAAGNTDGVAGFSDKGVFLGSSGNDSFSAGSGSVQFGQGGDDTFTLNSLAFGVVAGGTGSDTAVLAVNHQTLDLASASAIHLLGIDTIALGNGLNNTLAVNSAALLTTVADQNSTEYTLTITGDATDTLDLAGSDFLLNTNADNSIYRHYDSGHQHLLVGVAVNIINGMTA